MAVACFNPPTAGGPAIFYYDRPGIQGYGRTNVSRHTIPAITDFPFRSRIRFDHQMLFAMRNGLGGRGVKEVDARVRIFRGNRLVAQVETQAPVAWLADDSR